MDLTDKMLEAGCVEYRSDFLSIPKDQQEALKKTIRSVWTAMLSAVSASTEGPPSSNAPDDKCDDDAEHTGRLVHRSFHDQVVAKVEGERDAAVARCKEMEAERGAIGTSSPVAVDQVARIIAEYPEDWAWPGKVSTPTLNKYRMLASKVLGALAAQPATQAPVPVPTSDWCVAQLSSIHPGPRFSVSAEQVRELFKQWLTKHSSAAPAQASVPFQVGSDADRLQDAECTIRELSQKLADTNNREIDARQALVALRKRSPGPGRAATGVSPSWVLSQLAGMQFRSPAGADAYDYVKRCLAAAFPAEGPVSPEPVHATDADINGWANGLASDSVAAGDIETEAMHVQPQPAQADTDLYVVIKTKEGHFAIPAGMAGEMEPNCLRIKVLPGPRPGTAQAVVWTREVAERLYRAFVAHSPVSMDVGVLFDAGLRVFGCSAVQALGGLDPESALLLIGQRRTLEAEREELRTQLEAANKRCKELEADCTYLRGLFPPMHKSLDECRDLLRAEREAHETLRSTSVSFEQEMLGLAKGADERADRVEAQLQALMNACDSIDIHRESAKLRDGDLPRIAEYLERVNAARILATRAQQPPKCVHDWQDTGGAASGDSVETFQRCAKCQADQTIETPRVEAQTFDEALAQGREALNMLGTGALRALSHGHPNEGPKLPGDRNKGRVCICGANLEEPGSRMHHTCKFTNRTVPVMPDREGTQAQVERIERALRHYLDGYIGTEDSFAKRALRLLDGEEVSGG